MKRVLLFLAIIAFSAGCANDDGTEGQQMTNAQNAAKTAASGASNVVPVYDCAPQVIDINAGQNYLAGNITIGSSVSNVLYVTYNANPNWKFTQLHLYVGALSGVPQKNGNPTPGKFPYTATFNATTSTYTFEIPAEDIQKDANGCFVVAAHSNMSKTSASGAVIQSETGWAGYDNFSGGNWARYFNYCLCTTFG